MYSNNMNNQSMVLQKQLEDAKKKLAEQESEASKIAESEAAMEADMIKGAELGAEVIGDGLGRMSNDENLTQSRDLLAQQAQGPTSAQNLAQREQALEQLQGSEQSAQRSLLSSLSNAGVTGGAAGIQLADMTSSNLMNRRALERDLVADQTSFAQNAALQTAQLDQSISEFDLGQLAKEKNLDIQARLGYAELGSAERTGIRSAQAIEKSAEAAKSSGKK